MHVDPLALRKKGDPKSRKELIELPTLLWLVTILLPTAPGSLVTGTVVQAVVARGASLRLSPVFCLVCVCVCEGQEVHFQLSFSWGGYSLSITVTDKQQGGEKGRKEGRKLWGDNTAAGSRDSSESCASGAPKVLRESRSPLVRARPGWMGAGFRASWRCHTVALIILLGLELRWTLVCLDKWSLRANFFSHSEHSYGLMPEWERRWRDSSSDRENLVTQEQVGGVRNTVTNRDTEIHIVKSGFIYYIDN